MFGFERGKLEQARRAKIRGDQAAGELTWRPDTKRITWSNSRDPDNSRLYAVPSDLGHA